MSTNLVRRQQELEGVILSADSETLPMEAELKRQELKSSRGSIDKLKKQLEGMSCNCLFSLLSLDLVLLSKRRQFLAGVLKNIDGLTQKMQDIKTSKESLKVRYAYNNVMILWHLYIS